MKTTPVCVEDLRGSVIAVPPLARRADGSQDAAANGALLAHLKRGGISTYMYGGNANFYNLGVAELGTVVDALAAQLKAGEWLIPSVGPDFGKAREQLALLAERGFPTAMVLPLRFPSTQAGVATGLRKLAERYGRPLIAYVKDEGYLAEDDLAALVKDGAVCAVKYAIVREDPHRDAVLAALVERLGAERIISGIGERPVIDHFRGFGLRAFTSGSCCVAPALSNAIRLALLDGDDTRAAALRERFIALEDARDAYSPIRVLHAAVEAAGIAPLGPIGEFLSRIEDPAQLREIEAAAVALHADNAAALA
ncbi:dihydrodipicolinate synthase family protein [Burkholderia gladioli]|uniref:dihydrodipicolinate synthase family protein n=1 Tax=Burkholderia gladioli TaxID=28095 RepID=UPI00163EB40C